jgi:hypothetical protein
MMIGGAVSYLDTDLAFSLYLSLSLLSFFRCECGGGLLRSQVEVSLRRSFTLLRRRSARAADPLTRTRTTPQDAAIRTHIDTRE